MTLQWHWRQIRVRSLHRMCGLTCKSLFCIRAYKTRYHRCILYTHSGILSNNNNLDLIKRGSTLSAKAFDSNENNDKEKKKIE